jgi:hypothetical protein
MWIATQEEMIAALLNQGTRGWLARIGISLVAALLCGGLAYLIARAITGVALFVRQQQLLREIASAFQGGVEGLANGNLRAVRLLVQHLDGQNEQLSLLIGFGAAMLAVVTSYLWLERRAGLVDNGHSQ